MASGLAEGVVAAAVPPACRRPLDRPSSIAADGADVVVESPVWRPRAGGRHLVPSLSVLAPASHRLRLEVSVRDGTAWSPWIATASFGGGAFAPMGDACAALRCDVDVFTAATPVEAVRVRVRLSRAEAPAILDAPWLLALSACDLEGGVVESEAGPPARLPVPALSQMTAAPEIARRICSPTSVAMTLAYWGPRVEPEALAAEMKHEALDMYGIWPAAVAAAGRRGVLGYLLRFPDWAAAAWCLERGVPVIASIAYTAGELAGAPVEETTGHLVVLTGCEGRDVLVNDPAAATAADVPRRYRRDEFVRVWLERTGVGYVLFSPTGTPAAPS